MRRPAVSAGAGSGDPRSARVRGPETCGQLGCGVRRPTHSELCEHFARLRSRPVRETSGQPFLGTAGVANTIPRQAKTVLLAPPHALADLTVRSIS